jgi:hypothetical protein
MEVKRNDCSRADETGGNGDVVLEKNDEGQVD